MIRIGITGQHGFIGTALSGRVLLLPDEFTLVPLSREQMSHPEDLARWAGSCDAIVHLAAVNRAADDATLHEANLKLCEQLAAAVRTAGSAPHIVFVSSTQEARANAYGRSKVEGRQLLAAMADDVGATFTGMIIPNVFGPFGRPHYNSVVATFCHQLCRGETPRVDNDAKLNLIHVDEVVTAILDAIRTRLPATALPLAATAVRGVAEILQQLQGFVSGYLQEGRFPTLSTAFDLNLFNTFRSYIDHGALFPRALTSHRDARGAFTELVRTATGGQVSFSITFPGVTRGNHLHTRKVERFIVIFGSARIQLRRHRSDEVLEFHLDGATPSYVDMPVWYTHNITNVGDTELLTIFWINEAFDAADPDTFMDPVCVPAPID